MDAAQQRTLDVADLLHAHQATCKVCRETWTFCVEGAKLRASIDGSAARRLVIGDERRPRGSE